MCWPENEDWSSEFLRALSASQEGASTIPECFTAAAGIAAGDKGSWYRQWKKLADENAKRAIAAQRGENPCTARNSWLRASHYYRTAEAQLGSGDSRRIHLLQRMRACSRSFLSCMQPKGERIRIPTAQGASLETYFLPALGKSGRSPVVICLGGPDHFKDDHLFRLPRHAHERGLSLLLMEFPVQGTEQAGGSAHAIEDAVASCVDYLASRPDVDAERLALFGDGLGAAFASRAAAADNRFRAAVCDAGIVDLHERAFVARWMTRTSVHEAARGDVFAVLRTGIATRIRCPMYVVLGEREALDVNLAVELCKVLRDDGSDITLRVFEPSETGLMHGQIESSTVANEVVFDWLSDRLELKARPAKGELSERPRSDPAYTSRGLADFANSLRRQGAVARGK